MLVNEHTQESVLNHFQVCYHQIKKKYIIVFCNYTVLTTKFNAKYKENQCNKYWCPCLLCPFLPSPSHDCWATEQL